MERETRVDWLTVAGLGLLLMPLLTMWHEIGGHAATCLALGGRVTELGAFYVDCNLTGGAGRIVAIAGAAMDTVLALIAWALWRRATGDFARLLLWLVATSKGFVAAGYLLFSGVTGLGDFGPGPGGGIGPLPMEWLWRIALALAGGLIYWRLILISARALTAMLGDALATGPARKAIAHVYYGAQGMAAMVVGLFNPLGVFILLASAAASSFGGNAGMISLGFMVPRGQVTKPFAIPRIWAVVVLGVATTVAFAALLGPSIRF